MNSDKQKFNYSVILTACINPIDMHHGYGNM